MTRTLVWEKSFIRALKKASKRNPALEEKIYTTLDHLSENPFHSQLDTHKLHGVLQGLWACIVEYDCIVLIDIGTHDEIY